MSYSKILSATIAPLSWTSLSYTSGGENSTETSYTSVVWLYDGSIHFFKEPKHIILGVFAILVLLFLVFPYIILLLCGQWLQAYSNWWIISWINKLKPFMDAYHAPFRKHARYWTGLLLLSRLGLFMTFAINATGSDSVNLLAISSVAAALLAMKGRVYTRYGNDILESSFILNLCVLSVATFYVKDNYGGQSQLILSSLSVGTSFVTFICLLFFHAYVRFKSTRIYNRFIVPCTLKILPSVFRLFSAQVENNFEGHLTELLANPSEVTSTTVDIREPLLENDV
jgi:small basic protein